MLASVRPDIWAITSPLPSTSRENCMATNLRSGHTGYYYSQKRSGHPQGPVRASSDTADQSVGPAPFHHAQWRRRSAPPPPGVESCIRNGRGF